MCHLSGVRIFVVDFILLSRDCNIVHTNRTTEDQGTSSEDIDGQRVGSLVRSCSDASNYVRLFLVDTTVSADRRMVTTAAQSSAAIPKISRPVRMESKAFDRGRLRFEGKEKKSSLLTCLTIWLCSRSVSHSSCRCLSNKINPSENTTVSKKEKIGATLANKYLIFVDIHIDQHVFVAQTWSDQTETDYRSELI